MTSRKRKKRIRRFERKKWDESATPRRLVNECPLQLFVSVLYDSADRIPPQRGVINTIHHMRYFSLLRHDIPCGEFQLCLSCSKGSRDYAFGPVR